MLLILFLALATAILNGCGDSGGSSGQNSAETGTGNGDDTGGGSGGDDNAAAQGWNLDTGSNEADLAENLAFVRIAIDLDTQAITALSPELSVGEPDGGITPVLLGGETVASVSEDEFGLNITAELPADLHAEFVLGGAAGRPTATIPSSSRWMASTSPASTDRRSTSSPRSAPSSCSAKAAAIHWPIRRYGPTAIFPAAGKWI